jgi:hypothetical protein
MNWHDPLRKKEQPHDARKPDEDSLVPHALLQGEPRLQTLTG